MATRHRGYSVPARLTSTLSQAKVTFLDEISYSKLRNFEKEEISQEQGDEYSSKPSDSKNLTFSNSDKIQELKNDAHELPTEKARLRRTSSHLSARRPKFQNTKDKNQLEIKGEPKNDIPDKEPRERKTSGPWGSERTVRRNAFDRTHSVSEISVKNDNSYLLSDEEWTRERKTSRHWSYRGTRLRNASSYSVLSNVKSPSTFKMAVLKIVFVNILFSLVNKAFDFSQVQEQSNQLKNLFYEKVSYIKQ